MYIKTEKKTENHGLIKVTFNDDYAEIEYRQHHFVAPKIVVNDLLFVQCEDTDDKFEAEHAPKTVKIEGLEGLEELLKNPIVKQILELFLNGLKNLSK